MSRIWKTCLFLVFLGGWKGANFFGDSPIGFLPTPKTLWKCAKVRLQKLGFCALVFLGCIHCCHLHSAPIIQLSFIVNRGMFTNSSSWYALPHCVHTLPVLLACSRSRYSCYPLCYVLYSFPLQSLSSWLCFKHKHDPCNIFALLQILNTDDLVRMSHRCIKPCFLVLGREIGWVPTIV